MRSLAYGAAILAAVGIMVFIINTPEKPDAVTEQEAPASSESVAKSTPDIEIETVSLTMDVPEMHCPFACYPSVKENLEKRGDVVSVELAPQKEEGVIDNPQVIVTCSENFDADQAIAMLEAAGFAGSSVVEK